MYDLNRITHYEFKNAEIIDQAFAKRAMYKDQGLRFEHERLEILGDAVLDAVVSRLLIMERGVRGNLEELFNRLSREVSNDRLAAVFDELGLSWFVPIVDTKDKADVVEALIGAIYVDSGYDLQVCVPFISRFITKEDDERSTSDPGVWEAGFAGFTVLKLTLLHQLYTRGTKTGRGKLPNYIIARTAEGVDLATYAYESFDTCLGTSRNRSGSSRRYREFELAQTNISVLCGSHYLLTGRMDQAFRFVWNAAKSIRPTSQKVETSREKKDKLHTLIYDQAQKIRQLEGELQGLRKNHNKQEDKRDLRYDCGLHPAIPKSN
jgi:hypothetical protein